MPTGTVAKLNPSETPTESQESEWRKVSQVEMIAKVRDASNSYREILRDGPEYRLRYHVPTSTIEFVHVRTGEVAVVGPANWKYCRLAKETK
jgi:hypothetical protein